MTLLRDNMEEIIARIMSEPALMLLAAISAVILIFVLLVVVISSMRIKVYKDRYININIDNQEKDALLLKLNNELQELKIKNAQDEQELQHYANTKIKLKDTEDKLENLQNSTNELQKLQSETKRDLDHNINDLSKLREEYESLTMKFETIREENNKVQINNARLVMKLETEARYTASMVKK